MPAKGESPPARFRQPSQAAAATSLAVGLAVQFGEWCDVAFLRSVLPGGFAGVVGHAYGMVPMFHVEWLQGMAVHTSVLIVLMNQGILLSRPQRGMVRVLNQPSPLDIPAGPGKRGAQ